MRLIFFYFTVSLLFIGINLSIGNALPIPLVDTSAGNTATTSKSFSKQANSDDDFIMGGDTFILKPYSGNSDLAELPIGVESSMILFTKDYKSKGGAKILSYSIQYSEKHKANILPLNTNIVNYLSANTFKKIFLTLNDSNQVQLMDSENQQQRLRCVYKMPLNNSGNSSDNIKDFLFNHPDYNVVHATTNERRNKIVFASNMPGGYGGYDLYITYLNDTTLSKPINLGSKFNTSGDELFPYLLNDTQIFFSTNGYTGNNFDIYSGSILDKTDRALPVKGLDSEYNEFAFVSDASLNWGALATDRPNKYADYNIYNFFRKPKNSQQLYQIFRKDLDFKDHPSPKCVSLDIAQYIDTLGAAYLYQWDMGDGGTAVGTQVDYCYKKSGKYVATLKTTMVDVPSIIDTVLRVPIEINETLSLNVASLDTASILESTEFIVSHNWFGNSAYIEEAIWKTDEQTYFSGISTAIKFANLGWHKVEVMVRLNVEGKQKIMYQTRKVFIYK